MFVVIAIVVAYLSYALLKYHQKRQQLLKVSTHFKGPHPEYFLGNLNLFKDKSVAEILEVIAECHRKYGDDLTIMGAFNDLEIHIAGAQNAEKVLLAKTTRKSYQYDFLEAWLGTGLLLSFGEKWFQRRRIITPAFHFKILDQFMEVFNKEADLLVTKLDRHVDQKEFDIYDYITLFALDSICATSMGVHINAQDDPNNEYTQGVKKVSDYIFRRTFHLLSQFQGLYELLPQAREEKRITKQLHNFTNSIIEKRRKQLESPEAVGTIPSGEEMTFSKNRDSFLDQLLKTKVDGRPLSTDDIREEVDTFMFEGHDTTTSGIAFTVYNLAKHQDVQQKLFEEIDGMLGPDAKTVVLTNAVLQDLKYLDMVIKESLRIAPPVPFIGRKLVEDMEMNGTVIPAGTTISLNIFFLHRNPKVFPEPEKFLPERFSDDYPIKRGPYDYIPFSAGFRNCIGQKYALLEMKVTIVKLLASYRILPGESIEKVRFKADLVLRSTNGVPVKLAKRT